MSKKHKPRKALTSRKLELCLFCGTSLPENQHGRACKRDACLEERKQYVIQRREENYEIK